MKKLFSVILFFIFCSGFSQINSNDQVVYLDSLKRIGTLDNYQYLRVVKEYHLKKDRYDVAVYYKSGKIQMRATTTNKDILKLEGSAIYFFENGNRKKIVNYINNKPIGKEFEWYENGKIKSEIENLQGDQVGSEITKIIQYWDENNIQHVVDGEGEYTEKEENYSAISKGSVKNNLKEGVWIGNSSRYKINFTEKFINGRLISGKSIDSLGNEINYDKIIVEPIPKKGMQHFYNHISKSFRIPNYINNTVHGTLYFTFTIKKNGKIGDISVLNKDEFGLSEIAIKIIKNYKEWSIGYFRGIPIDQSFYLPITLK